MKVYCCTNLDLAGERWPDDLPVVPAVGDEIMSVTKWGSFQLTLKVVSVCWDCTIRDTVWIPRIELHMTDFQCGLGPIYGDPRGSIVAFYKWYAPLVGRTVSSFI